MHSCLPPAQTYPRVGRVVGRFYDEGGLPTAALAEVRTKAEDGKELKVCIIWLRGRCDTTLHHDGVTQTLLALAAGHAAPVSMEGSSVVLCYYQ